jgi:tungstate transport system substrate-binding protein
MIAVAALSLIAVPVATASSPVIVQGTTDIRDAGLLEEVIEPGFRAAFPQYELKYVPVGTGQALTNARAGQGDAVVTHAPSLEKTFVEEGYSLEPRGRAVFYSDYVIVGATSDPAAAAAAPHNAAAAFEAIARAGAEGKANFVSRGDNSGTNTEEKTIWKLTHVELNSLGEPGKAGTKEDASWYHKGGGGQAETVQLANQCPFSGGGCYDITDRGTFNRLSAEGAVSGLKIVAEKNEESAPGGLNLLTNPFDVYVVNPAKVTNVTLNVKGAEALVEYLTSERFQEKLASFPNTTSPAFFADAHPEVQVRPTFKTRTVRAGAAVVLTGSLTSKLPGAPAVAGQPVLLQRLLKLDAQTGPVYRTIARATTAATGKYTLNARAFHGGPLRIETPTTRAYPSFTVEPLLAVGALSETTATVGRLAVRAKVTLGKAQVKGRVVTLKGSVGPSLERDGAARIIVLGRAQGHPQRVLHRLRPRKGSAYKVNLKLAPGRWKLRVRYVDPGAVLPATSRAVSVSVR